MGFCSTGDISKIAARSPSALPPFRVFPGYLLLTFRSLHPAAAEISVAAESRASMARILCRDWGTDA
jgi:hypothetical protein